LGRHFTWILWTGTVAALQSGDFGNVGPVGSWTQTATFEEQAACYAGREKAVADLLRDNPGATKRKEDLVVGRKPLPGEEEMVVHSATRFLCLPDDAKPPQFVDPGVAPGR
jgi:hypothetical protein